MKKSKRRGYSQDRCVSLCILRERRKNKFEKSFPRKSYDKLVMEISDWAETEYNYLPFWFRTSHFFYINRKDYCVVLEGNGTVF